MSSVIQLPLDGLGMGAILSDDRRHRYLLWRRWNANLGACTFIALNPSTADETADDPTVRRCKRFATDWGFGMLWMLNLFALRSTNPHGLREVDDPVGPMNDRWLVTACKESALVVAAWGLHGKLCQREEHVLGLLRFARVPVFCLGLTQGGSPRHPLYMRATAKPIPLAA